MDTVQKAPRKIKTNTLISWGASVVIIGLMFKILDWEGGEWMIAVGMAVEACLFFILGLEYIRERDNEAITVAPAPAAPVVPKASSLDDLLATSINQRTIERLNRGFEQFNKTVESVNELSGNAHAHATKDMVTELQNATQELMQLRRNLTELNNAYRAQLDAFRKS